MKIIAFCVKSIRNCSIKVYKKSNTHKNLFYYLQNRCFRLSSIVIRLSKWKEKETKEWADGVRSLVDVCTQVIFSVTLISECSAKSMLILWIISGRFLDSLIFDLIFKLFFL